MKTVDRKPDSLRPVFAAGGNPFTQQRIERLAYRFPDGGDWASNLERLKKLNFRALIVGGHGTGKSTLIRELRSRLSGEKPMARPITEPLRAKNTVAQPIDDSIRNTILLDVPRVTENDQLPLAWLISSRRAQRSSVANRLRELEPGTLLLVDGIERLAWLDRQRLVHWTASESRVAGLIVIVHHRRNWLRLPTWIETRPSETLLVELIDELLADQLQSVRSRIHHRARVLFQRYRHSIRAVLRQLYDEWTM